MARPHPQSRLTSSAGAERLTRSAGTVSSRVSPGLVLLKTFAAHPAVRGNHARNSPGNHSPPISTSTARRSAGGSTTASGMVLMLPVAYDKQPLHEGIQRSRPALDSKVAQFRKAVWSREVVMRYVVAVAIAGLSLSLVGCGGPSAEEKRAQRKAAAASASAEAEASASAEAEARRQAKLEAARAAQDECKGQLGDLLSALKQIDGRLDVGLSYQALGDRLGDVAVAYNAIPFRKLSPPCVGRVGIPLEAAYNQYNKSHTKWGACIDDFSCSVEGAKLAELRAHWSKASRLIGRAQRALGSPATFMNV